MQQVFATEKRIKSHKELQSELNHLSSVLHTYTKELISMTGKSMLPTPHSAAGTAYWGPVGGGGCHDGACVPNLKAFPTKLLTAVHNQVCTLHNEFKTMAVQNTTQTG